MRSRFKRAFGSILWNSGFVVMLAVLDASQVRAPDKAWNVEGDAEPRRILDQ
jgi:hypothetical protein